MKQGGGCEDDVVDYSGLVSCDGIHRGPGHEEFNKLITDNITSHNNHSDGIRIMNFFKDGEKRIDFMLAYVKTKFDAEDGKTNKFKSYRENYISHLKKKGLLLEDAQPTNCNNNNASELYKHKRYVSFRRKKGDSVQDCSASVRYHDSNYYYYWHLHDDDVVQILLAFQQVFSMKKTDMFQYVLAMFVFAYLKSEILSYVFR